MKAIAADIAAGKPRQLSWPLVWTVVIGLLLAWGRHAHLERYITPQRGIGYWLGIAGGSMMVLLLTYSARKRISWLRRLGGISAWFKFHMVLGVIGPVLILFHANFNLGSTNSNVALISMLLVAGSGLIGRYIYTRLHAHVDGKEDTLEHLKIVGARLRSQKTSIELLPGLLDAIDRVEQRFISPPKGISGRLLHLSVGPYRIAMARSVVRREIEASLLNARRRHSPLVAARARRMAAVTRRYAYRRLDTARRVTEFRIYTRIFSVWHVLHIPLFFMLLITGIVHVVAINLY